MATSTFEREFKVKLNNVDEFVSEMERKVSPTLDGDFRSRSVEVKDVKELLCKALKNK